jgi:putative membrane protein
MSMIKTIFVAAALGVTLGGCMSTSAPVATIAATTATTATAFAPMAGSSNLLEIESSRLALRRSRDSQVKRLAKEMIRDHTMASRRMMTVMRSSGIQQTPPVLSSRHQAMLAELEATPASEFDAAYLRLQTMAHDEAITLHRTYAQNGDNPRMMAFAREILPKLEMHAEHLQSVSQSET